MSFAVRLTCGDRVIIIDARDTPPFADAWVLFPLDDDNSIDTGDEMTCVVCDTTQIITTVEKELCESPHSLQWPARAERVRKAGTASRADSS